MGGINTARTKTELIQTDRTSYSIIVCFPRFLAGFPMQFMYIPGSIRVTTLGEGPGNLRIYRLGQNPNVKTTCSIHSDHGSLVFLGFPGNSESDVLKRYSYDGKLTNGLKKKQIKQSCWTFSDLETRFQTFPAGSRGDFLRIIRI